MIVVARGVRRPGEQKKGYNVKVIRLENGSAQIHIDHYELARVEEILRSATYAMIKKGSSGPKYPGSEVDARVAVLTELAESLRTDSHVVAVRAGNSLKVKLLYDLAVLNCKAADMEDEEEEDEEIAEVIQKVEKPQLGKKLPRTAKPE